MRCTLLCLFVVGLYAAVARADEPHPGPPPGYDTQTVWQSGEGGYLFYRIPSVVVTKAGSVLIFCEARRSEWGKGADSGEINLLMRRSTDGGKTFSEPQVVWADGPNTCGNPTAVVDADTGRILLLSTHNMGNYREGAPGEDTGTRTVWLLHSDDDGVTWSDPRDITDQVKKPHWEWYATGPGVGIQLRQGEHAGRIVIPANHTSKTDADGGRIGNAHVFFSDDGGETWQLGGSPVDSNFNESQIVELADGRLMLNMRNTSPNGRRHAPKERGVAISDDGGLTFPTVYRDEALIEPICQASIVRFTWPTPQGGKSRILFANPANDTPERIDMTVRISYDEGETWAASKSVFKGWSCYSSLVPLSDGSFGLLYEAGGRARYERLEFVRLTLDWLTNGEDTYDPNDRLELPANQVTSQAARE